MDEGLLNDLLECSVCLERLDTSSRVLPCQHTFCLKCLKVIVESHKELRCPECRVLVEARVDELPPNVLLMRILEGMRNAPRKPAPAARQRAAHSHQGQPASGHFQSAKQPPPHARALYDYISKEAGDLSFKKGETILLQKRLDPFWYQGESGGRTGVFPITFVQVLYPLPVPTALCKALYDFKMSAPDEEGCLAFDKGAIITVHRRVDENWAEGRLEERVGIFPIAFVELNSAARQLMNTPPLNRAVPPLPDGRAPHPEHRHHTQHPHRYQPMSLSTPSSQATYQNVAAMSQSHPTFQQPMLAPTSQILLPTQISHLGHGLVTTTAVPRNIMEPNNTKHLELIHMTNMHNKSHLTTMGLQSVSRINDGFDRLRTVKYDSYNSTPVHHKTETTYQNVRVPVSVATFNTNNSSDSSSSANTPSVGVSSTTTPNTSSNTSSCESAEPSVPSSPDNAERNATTTPNTSQNTTQDESTETADVNQSMGVLSLNESSTATNTSLNVSLPAESANESAESASKEPTSLNVPSTSKNQNRSSGPDSLLSFGLGLQAALSPCHGKDKNYMTRAHREHNHRDKRHSLTPSTHLNANHSQNRHSAEILATSLLSHSPRGSRSHSAERLPAAYLALHAYSPQRPDELPLRKGGIYVVVERCRDGWYKGRSERGGRCGVFPGNYVAPRPQHHAAPVAQPQAAAVKTPAAATVPPAPPRAASPVANTVQPASYPWTPSAQPLQSTPKSDKSKDKSKPEKSTSTGVSLMKRLAAMKKCKSPPPAGYSMDNPVFEDSPGTSVVATHHPVHVSRSGDSPWQAQHRKSQSLDASAARRERHHSQTVKERYRCIVPYPPNSEYELELQLDDIVIVHKKRADGWLRGTHQRTGRSGLFPASFVQSCPE
ncbi:E3 ubiquitin-protein ligase SH3RF3 isoform X2 [Plutella xylostella]|uniref:E3 ubiquitin-protein ligase SH3RF3 isoform X2 n=1 Tax=Plutella xylostella TaxID=51655 RepID=UPI002032C5A7|nr:E3 ubiquitin-protein ligase SH3RF3 isoform X2 [Plutella xylostella]